MGDNICFIDLIIQNVSVRCVREHGTSAKNRTTLQIRIFLLTRAANSWFPMRGHPKLNTLSDELHFWIQLNRVQPVSTRLLPAVKKRKLVKVVTMLQSSTYWMAGEDQIGTKSALLCCSGIEFAHLFGYSRICSIKSFVNTNVWVIFIRSNLGEL